MTLATRADLITECQDWLFGRADIVAKVPTFIRMFEAKANRILRCRQMENRARAMTDAVSNEPEFVTLPGDFQTMRRVRLSAITGKPRLGFRTSAQLDEMRDATQNRAGQPSHFTIAGDEMELYPTPSASVELEMTYRRNLPALVDPLDSNWLLDGAPDAYLYGSLLEAAPYLHEDERIAVWAEGVKGAFQQLNDLSEDATFNAGPLTVRRKGTPY